MSSGTSSLLLQVINAAGYAIFGFIGYKIQGRPGVIISVIIYYFWGILWIFMGGKGYEKAMYPDALADQPKRAISEGIRQKSYLDDFHFKENVFRNLRWGMNIKEIKSCSPESDRALEAVPGRFSIPYWPFHRHIGILTFHIGAKGLYMLTVSFIFRIRHRYLTQDEIVDKSNNILKELSRLYGEPEVNAPWHPEIRKFNYIWIMRKTYIQFAWDGGNLWAIHFRSIDLDPQVQEIIKEIRSF